MRYAQQLVEEILQGKHRSIARAISHAENGSPEAQEIVSLIYSRTGKAHIIGITGPGGSGKSTLVEKLVRELRRRGKTIGVVAIDPTSPFSGGAFLGDRIRMQDLSTDQGVFIRSMATRSNPGGLAKATKDAVCVLDASGKDIVIVETAGAGQSEVDIIKVAQTVVVVLAPGLGDEIQAIKAGIMEIGDIFVVNKADRDNADKALIDIQTMLELGSETGGWKKVITKTIAITGEGTQLLLEKIGEHREYLEKRNTGKKQKENLESELIEALKQKIAEHIVAEMRRKGELDKLVSRILAKEIDPFTAAESVISELLKKPVGSK
ncbi:MAG: methylmalonyl Co-A mutase-associated GTPase MeaB [Candidatus Bathyarchaeota archaeon]|nr:MAG: methylmalonyl Co-A mutase-associated GTPase MeaB [Candidatus Bathyarchaeota archaeon]